MTAGHVRTKTTDPTSRASAGHPLGRTVRANLSTAELYEDAIRASRGALHEDTQLVRADGSTVWVSVPASLISTASGLTLTVFAITFGCSTLFSNCW